MQVNTNRSGSLRAVDLQPYLVPRQASVKSYEPANRD
jgi:hypothetical protein